jgi:hypothetical protein
MARDQEVATTLPKLLKKAKAQGTLANYKGSTRHKVKKNTLTVFLYTGKDDLVVLSGTNYRFIQFILKRQGLEIWLKKTVPKNRGVSTVALRFFGGQKIIPSIFDEDGGQGRIF